MLDLVRAGDVDCHWQHPDAVAGFEALRQRLARLDAPGREDDRTTQFGKRAGDRLGQVAMPPVRIAAFPLRSNDLKRASARRG